MAVSVIVTALGFVGYSLYGLVVRIRAINEPNPKSVDLLDITRILSNDRVSVRIDDLVYVNRDFNAYIFLGQLSRSTNGKSADPKREVWDRIDYDTCYPNSFGEVRQFKQGDRLLFGIVRSTTATEWQQGKSRFLTKWAESKAVLLQKN